MAAVELPVPPIAQASDGTEILRAFIVNGGLQISLQRAFEEPDVWGILLADIARHASRVYANEEKLSQADVLVRICDLFAKEVARPTDFGSTDVMRRN